LEGHQREIMAHMTVEEIYRYIFRKTTTAYDKYDYKFFLIYNFSYQIWEIKEIANYYFRDRKTFSAKVFEVSSMDLVNMGIVVISYTIHDVKVRSHLHFNDMY
jgi:hypothetical protein